MNPFDFIAQRREQVRRRRRNVLLVCGPAVVGLFGLICLGVSSEETDANGTPVSSAVRTGALVTGIFLILVALVAAFLAYRSVMRADSVASGSGQPLKPDSDVSTRRLADGPSLEFWMTTAIAVLSLVIAAASAPWWWN